MPITEKQRELRRSHLGASDVPAILGLDRFRTPYDIWLSKTGKLQEEDQQNDAAFAGTVFEEGVLAYAERQLGKLIKNQYRSAKGLPIGANIDAILVENGNPVEAKTAGLYGPLYENWGEAGTDQVPDRVLIQAHAQMLCAEKEICHIAAFLGGRGFALYYVPRDNELIQIISDKSVEFWEKNVKADIPPEYALPSLAVIKRIQREPETKVDIPAELVTAWQAAKDAFSAAATAKELAEAQLLAALGTAEAGMCELGSISYLEQTRKAHMVKESTFRVLRFKKSN